MKFTLIDVNHITNYVDSTKLVNCVHYNVPSVDKLDKKTRLQICDHYLKNILKNESGLSNSKTFVTDNR